MGSLLASKGVGRLLLAMATIGSICPDLPSDIGNSYSGGKHYPNHSFQKSKRNKYGKRK